MILWVFTIVIFLILIFVDLPSVYGHKSKKSVFVYVILMAMAFGIIASNLAGIKIPGPSGFIKNMVNMIIGA